MTDPKQTQPKALVIDQDEKVQKEISEFMTKLGFIVVVASSREELPHILKSNTFELLFCSREIAGIDALALCRALKKSSDTPSYSSSLSFVLYTTRQNAIKIKDDAHSSGVDHLLSRPIRTDLLHSIADEVCDRIKKMESNRLKALIVSDDHLLKQLLTTVLTRRNSKVRHCDSVFDASLAGAEEKFQIVFTEQCNCLDLTWYNNERHGKIVAIQPQTDKPQGTEVTLANTMPSAICYTVSRPLCSAGLEPILAQIAPELPKTRSHEFHLQPEEQALLAARISAGIYEKILTARVLATGNWRRAAQLGYHETLAICGSFSNRVGKS